MIKNFIGFSRIIKRLILEFILLEKNNFKTKNIQNMKVDVFELYGIIFLKIISLQKI